MSESQESPVNGASPLPNGQPAQFTRDKASGLWKCHLCSFSSQYRGSLRSHYTVHSNERPYACDLCSYEAKRSYDLKKHKVFKHGKKNLATRSIYKTSSASTFAKYSLKKLMSSGSRSKNPLSTGDHEVPPTSVRPLTAALPSLPYSSAVFPEPQVATQVKTEVGREDSPPSLVAQVASAQQSHGDAYPSLVPSNVPNIIGSLLPAHLLSPRHVHSEPSPSPEQSGIEHNNCAPRLRTSSESSNTSGPSASLGNQVIYPGQSPQSKMAALPSSLQSSNAVSPKASSSSQGASYSSAQPSFIMPLSVYTGYTAEAAPTAAQSSYNDLTVSYYRVPISRRKSRPIRQSNMVSEDELSDVREYSSASPLPSSTTKEMCVGTRKAWHCPHCEVLFLDSAIYFMHAGLHSSQDPWRCNLCNHKFYDVYSFTSHFITNHK